jgi:hypothetical protein
MLTEDEVNAKARELLAVIGPLCSGLAAGVTFVAACNLLIHSLQAIGGNEAELLRDWFVGELRRANVQ